MGILTLISYLLCFVAGLAFGKYVKWLDWHGTKNRQIQISTGDNVNQVQIGDSSSKDLSSICKDGG